MYWFKAKHEKRVRHLYLRADTLDEALAKGRSEIIELQRNARGLTALVWREGTIQMMDERDTIHPFEKPVFLRVVEGD